MALILARVLAAVFAGWVTIGVVFALYYVTRGVARVCPEAREGSVGFRVLIFPATVALWPVLLWRSARGQSAAPTEHNGHRDHGAQS